MSGNEEQGTPPSPSSGTDPERASRASGWPRAPKPIVEGKGSGNQLDVDALVCLLADFLLDPADGSSEAEVGAKGR